MSSVLENLVNTALNIDKDGMDLSFTNSDDEVNGSNTPAMFKRAMQKESSQPIDGVTTDISSALDSILAKYYESLQTTFPRPSRALTINRVD